MKMITLTEEEKNFIKRAIVSLKQNIIEFDLDPTNKEELLEIINMYRSKGFMISRSADGGKDFDIWEGLRLKLGSPVKDQKTLLLEQLQRTADGEIEILNKIHNDKIKNLKKKLENAETKKIESINLVEQKIIDEIKSFDNKRNDALKRLEIAKKAHEKIIRIKKHEKHKESEVDGLVKCWECGEWFKAGAGISAHKRAKHGE